MTVRSVIYFYRDNSRDLIKIGFSDAPSKRGRTHESYGLELIAAIPATFHDEQELHKSLATYRNGHGKEWYASCDDICNFITNLIVRGYAGRSFAEASTKPYVPYAVWRFGEKINWTAPNGQINLLEQYDPKERMAAAHRLIHLSSETDDWYTPSAITDCARNAMGSIDLDPASCFEANESIMADVWYSREIDGLDPRHPWSGNVWLNPPYGTGDHSASAFVERLISELASGNVAQAITCLNLGSTGSLWFDSLWRTARRHLIYRGRINFIPPNGNPADSSPSKGTILSYFGSRVDEFSQSFGHLGTLIEVTK